MASRLCGKENDGSLNMDVDLFGIPHSRMKQLVKETSTKVFNTDFSDDFAVEGLLNSLNHTFHEFKHHEEIENHYIMAKLRTRVTRAELLELLTNIHHDTHVTDILTLVKRAVQHEYGDTFPRSLLKMKLQRAVREFIDDFVPHMEEEEEIFQPLLSTYFTRNELHNLQQQIVYLHKLSPENEQEENAGNESIEDIKDLLDCGISSLPNELLLYIFSYLSPRDICRCAGVCRQWSKLASDGSLWQEFYPVRWIFYNDWRTGLDEYEPCSCDDGPCDGKSHWEKESGKYSADSTEDYEEEIDQKRLEVKHNHESNHRRLLLMAQYLIPAVGDHVKVLVLGCCPGLTNGLLYKILSYCKNLHFLDLSQTNISDLGLNGLFRKNGGRQLRHVDLSGCAKLTDKTLKKLSCALGKATQLRSSGSSCSDNQSDSGNEELALKSQGLRYLSLSGCYKITDDGLRTLAKCGSLKSLACLDLSGCLNLSAEGLQDFVAACPSLNHESLFYCDNISEGPFPDTAGGCQNLECTKRVCCRTGLCS